MSNDVDETAEPTQSPTPAKESWYKRKWVIGVAAGVLGLAIGAGAASSTAVKDSQEYKTLSSKLDDTKSQLADAESKVAKVDDREAKLDERQNTVEAGEAQLNSDKLAVEEREEAVGDKEAEVKANTISGEGTYEVGVDMKPGKYKSKNDSECYWSVNADSNGDNILNNGLNAGPQTVTVKKGQYFETARCGDWVRQ